jgi:alpha/beta superfamily hydrolase
MKISQEMRAAVKPASFGAVGRAIALAIIGFTWGGWVTGGHAKTLADAAVSAALVPICADKFQAVGALALSTLKAEKTTVTMTISSSSSWRRSKSASK